MPPAEPIARGRRNHRDAHLAGADEFKYSLFYGRPGEVLVLFDNERGKGDHKTTSTSAA
jgi:hypothetical protein